jgi:pre-mRNA-splicing factor SYF1
LWYNYLKEAREYVKQWSVDDRRYEVINDLHERALIYINKMPRMWLDYCQFLTEQRLITQTRKTYDRALMSLPVTQHEKIWDSYIDWVTNLPIAQTAICVYKRYLKFNPDAREDFVYFLLSNGRHKDAMLHIISLLDDDLFHSKKGKSKFDYWLMLCEIITKQTDKVKEYDCESIIRHGLSKFTDEVGRLWVALCNYYIKQGLFEKARDIFEEALSKVSTARDFSIVFNSYLKFEEELVTTIIKMSEGEEEEYQDDYETQLEKLIDASFAQLGIDNSGSARKEFNKNAVDGMKSESRMNLDLNVKFFRMTNLIERRPFLLSDALLRQNPHNIKEWLKRVKLCKEDRELTIQTFERAVKTVDPNKAFGRYDSLWIEYAKFYESLDELGKANEVFLRAINLNNFKSSEQLSNIWCEFAEMHIRCNNYYDAYLIVKTACTARSDKKEKGQSISVTHSLRLWTFYVDLEERLGTFENVKSIYQRIMDLKIANTQIIFNFCDFLEKHMYFEETFKVYEQALNFFTWPSLYDVWVIYLTKFVERYNGDKIERARDLFEQVLSTCPKDKIKIFYYMYADLEEKYGLLNNSIRILDKGCTDVLKEDRPESYSVLISKTANFFGITKTRNVFNVIIINYKI